MIDATKLVACSLVLLGATALAQDDSRPPPAQSPPPSQSPPPAPQRERQAEAETPPAQRERPEVDEDEFIPTEELLPDAAVTFPVDI
jgi:hypothetical protein